MEARYIVYIILVGLLVMLVWNKLRYDVVALMALTALVLTGLIDEREAFLGMAEPAVVTVAAVLVLSFALSKSGLADIVASSLKWTSGNTSLQIMVLCFFVALLSGFMNNVGALALSIPIAIRLSYRSGQKSSYYLMPLAFASLVGGLITLIGTPPNMIISGYRESITGEPFSMFSFARVGIPLTLVMVLFLGFFSWRILAFIKRNEPAEGDDMSLRAYMSEVNVVESSGFAGSSVGELRVKLGDVELLAVVKDDQKIWNPSDWLRIEVGDSFLVEVESGELDEFFASQKFKKIAGVEYNREALEDGEMQLKEVIVSAASSLQGQSAAALDLSRNAGLILLGISRLGAPIKEYISHTELHVGDVLLVKGEPEKLERASERYRLVPLGDVQLNFGSLKKLFLTIGFFALAITAAIAGWLQVQTAFVCAVLALLLTRVIDIRESYRAIDGGIVILLAALFPLGLALERSGAAEELALMASGLLQGAGPYALLVMIMAITIFLTNIINNAAAALLMAPVAASMGEALGVPLDRVLMATAIAASCAFMSPIGHQSNTLVLEPGNYRFSDYTKVGFFATLIVLVLAPLLLIQYF